MTITSFLIGLGSNRGHGRHPTPARMIAAALAALADEGLRIMAAAPVIRTPALGPGGRDFANGAALIETALAPPALLALLKRIERWFGRRPGRRWGARPIDLDILAWSGGAWPPRPAPRSGPLLVPHPALVTRGFALGPAARLAPRWRLPGSAVPLVVLEARRARLCRRARGARAGPACWGP